MLVEVQGEGLVARVELARGAKIVSLRSNDGAEWLAQQHADSTSGPGVPFVEAEMCGWDECAPTIVACELDGRTMPDHGELWDMPFSLDEDGCTAVARGASLDYEFRRRISPSTTGLRVDYCVTALSDPIPFLWAAHPQFSAPPGTRVELEGVQRVVDVMDPERAEHAWSAGLASIDTVEVGGCRKLYAVPDQEVCGARLIRPDQGALVLRWSAECPYVGVWFDACAYSHEPVIAIEPATAFYDSLVRAVNLGRAPMLEPGRPFRWWVELGIDSSSV